MHCNGTWSGTSAFQTLGEHLLRDGQTFATSLDSNSVLVLGKVKLKKCSYKCVYIVKQSERRAFQNLQLILLEILHGMNLTISCPLLFVTYKVQMPVAQQPGFEP